MSVIAAPFEQRRALRSYNAAKTSGAFAEWIASATSSDTEIRGNFRKLVDRSRDLERNNDYQRGFLLACERNILGAVRNDLRMDCGDYVFSRAKAPVWQPDRLANSLIEQAWLEWAKKGNCTVCGRYSWRDVKRLCVRGTPRDGNFLARKVKGPNVNRFGFALQLWEIDHLDFNKCETRRDGSEIRFGVEYNANKRPVAYWLFAAHPGDINGGGIRANTSTRFLADEIYHVYLPERVEQSLGVPWVVSAITRLRQLGAFEEAAVIAARLGATKSGFFKRGVGPNGEMGEWEGGTNSQGNPVMDAAPGSFEALPQGWDLASWSPEYPNIETSEFRKAMLRGVGTSVGMSYNTLGNDLESVNFSSARVGLFEEREMWKTLQTFYAESFWEPVFPDWLEAWIMSGAINLPMAKFAKFNRPIFKSRRWPFIDPLKEVSAAAEAIALRISSRRQFIEEGGGDVEDVFHDNKDDENLANEIGLSLQPPDPRPEAFGEIEGAAKPVNTKPDDEEDDEEELPENAKAKKPKAKQ